MNAWFILSIVLNIILLLLLFFKSALNEVLLDIYKTRKEKKRKRKEDLIKLRSLLWDFSSAFARTAMFGLIYFRTNHVDELKDIEPAYKASQERFDLTAKSLQDLKFDLDPKIRGRLDEVLTEGTKCVAMAINSKLNIFHDIKFMGLKDFIKYSTDTQQLCMDFAKDVEAMIIA
jgi:hypothetical protein